MEARTMPAGWSRARIHRLVTIANIEELPEVESLPGQRKDKAGRSSVISYSATFATEFLVMLGQIVLYKLVASGLGQTGFSEYAVARRVIVLLQPFTIMGLGVGLPRYLALAEGRGQSDRGSKYFWGTALCVGAFTTMLSSAFMIFPVWLSYLFFGNAEYRYLITPLLLMLLGMAAHLVLYAFLRGKLAVGWANRLQLINNGLVPLLVFSFSHGSAASFLRYLGLAWTATTVMMFLLMPISAQWKNPLKEARELLNYGVRRVPGDFALMALLALPAIFAAHLAGIHQAGLVAFGLAIVNMIASVFAPIGIFLLPKVSRAIGGGHFQPIQREIVLIRRFTLVLSIGIVLLVELLASPLIRLYLGQSYLDARPLISVLVVGALPLAFYYTMRSAIDAVHFKAVNTLNLLLALGLFLVGACTGSLLSDARYSLWAFPVSLALLGLLTQREIGRIIKPGEVHPGTVHGALASEMETEAGEACMSSVAVTGEQQC